MAEDNRRLVNAVMWNLRTSSPSSDLPPDYEYWKNTHRRFCRWRDNGHWEKLLTELIKEPDFEWLMIDTSHVKAHCHTTGAVAGNEAIGLKKGAQHQDTSGRGCA